MRSILNKNLPLLLLLTYVYIAILGLVPMADHHHNPMVNCPYMIGQSLCSMGLFEHIEAWKAYLLSIPVSQFIVTLFALTLILIFIRISSSPPILRKLLYYKKIQFVPIVSDIQLQFSKGILNPKPY